MIAVIECNEEKEMTEEICLPLEAMLLGVLIRLL